MAGAEGSAGTASASLLPSDSLFGPVIDHLAETRLVCLADDDPRATQPANGQTTRIEDLGSALAGAPAPDLLAITGAPRRHHLAAVAAAVSGSADARRRTSILVIGGAERGLAPDVALRAVASATRRTRTARAVLHAATTELARSLGPEHTVLWDPEGIGLVVPPNASGRVRDRFAGIEAALDRLASAIDLATDRKLDAFDLVEDLHRAQGTGEKVVASLRFRIGTRIVRAGRRLRRDDATFRAPREILARSHAVEEWEHRLGGLRPPTPPALPPDAPRIRFVLPELRLSGGALVVAELVDEMRLLGADAGIETLRVRADATRLPLVVAPRVHGSPETLAAELGPCDVAVATHWTTAEWVTNALRSGRAGRVASYLQDYEPWFLPESDRAGRKRVRDAFASIEDRVVTSRWLADLLLADGLPSVVEPPGLDLSVFAPRPAERNGPPLVVAMARPRTPRRGFETVVATLERVHRARPDVRIALFGERLGAMPLPFPCTRIGVVTDQDALARLLASARVHYDGSDFQAFGRTALEAMACGTPSVLTAVGGTGEYARPGVNALVVPPRDPDAAAAAVLRFIDDPAFAATASASGLATVPAFSNRRRARALLDHLTRTA